MSNVYIDGVDKTSTVSGSLGTWWNKKTIKFTSEARTIAVFGRDWESGCRTGGFAMKCTSSDPDWSNFTTDLATDNVWKVKGSYYVESDVNKVCPSNWASPDYDDSTWEKAVLADTNNADSIRGVPNNVGVSEICGSGRSWCFRKTVGRKTHDHFSLIHYLHASDLRLVYKNNLSFILDLINRKNKQVSIVSIFAVLHKLSPL